MASYGRDVKVMPTHHGFGSSREGMEMQASVGL
jgi:hypothetical protein